MADAAAGHEDGALGGAATLGGQPDPRAATIGPVPGAFDEAAFSRAGDQHHHTRARGALIDGFDGYNRAYPKAVKNAPAFVYREWN
ncbi:hypothetical protein [Streptomyces sp. NPDC101234]|uniref:hypothetical protein n=1 Tax=Streptomyces sp. NPDC101234 TaxID=3366138 RepID=UPI00381998E9